MRILSLFILTAIYWPQCLYAQTASDGQQPTPTGNATLHLKKYNKGELKDISTQLDTILHYDQVYRTQLQDIRNKKGFNTQEESRLWKLINSQDSINLKKVEKIIDKYGWLGKDQIGESASRGLFLVIQHANLNVQQKYLPLLQDAVKQGASQTSDYAYLIDRVNMRTGKPQIYGTQTNILDNICYAYPITDISNINQRRKEAGLSSIEQYFKEASVKYDTTPYTKEEERKRDSLLITLNEMYNEDQKNITQYIDVLKKFGKGSEQEAGQKDQMNKSNAILIRKAQSVLDNYGWPGYRMIGIPGCTTLFLIICHADSKIIEKYLPSLAQQALKGEASNGYVATFKDKIEVANGRPQIYGTQINNIRVPYPILDENSVNKRRKELGLVPLSDYLKQTYGIDYHNSPD